MLFVGIRSTNGRADPGMMSRPGRKVPCKDRQYGFS